MTAASQRVRVLIVDDSAFMRKALTTMLADDPAIEVIGQATNGREGLEMTGRLKPDVVTMDIEMPQMDGLTALRRIMAECPTNVLMLSSLSSEGSRAAMTAHQFGAADVMAKEASHVSINIVNIKADLLARIKALGERSRRPRAIKQASFCQRPCFQPGQFELVCIGSSTGGPPVVEKILTALPSSFSAPIVVAQHMPEMFTRSMAERLGQYAKLKVVHAEDGMSVQPATIHVCPGGRNTHIKRTPGGQLRLQINREPAGTIYWPSVDALLASAAQAIPARTLAIVLTGIGEDGLRGARPLAAAGGTIIAQSEETCVVYGMPKAVTQAALVAASLSPDEIASALRGLAGGSGTADAARLRKAG
jgi:two-component system chemotaxis response regulator CheB